MKANQAAHSVTTMCRVLGVSASGYYAWQQRDLSPRARQDRELLEQIRASHQRSRGTYGAPRIHRDLRAAGPGSAASGWHGCSSRPVCAA